MTELTLLIDTSIYGAAVGILKQGERDLSYSAVTDDVADSARQLPIMVERGLIQAGASKSEITSVIVSQGPGSFTGVRVGLAYVYGLAYGLEGCAGSRPQVSGVSSLQCIAEYLARRENADVVLCLPATKSGGYMAYVKNGITTLAPLDLTVDFATTDWPGRWFVIGAWEALSEKVGGFSSVRLDTLDLKSMALDSIRIMGELMTLGAAINWSESLPDALYLRKSTVEEKAEQQ